MLLSILYQANRLAEFLALHYPRHHATPSSPQVPNDLVSIRDNHARQLFRGSTSTCTPLPCSEDHLRRRGDSGGREWQEEAEAKGAAAKSRGPGRSCAVQQHNPRRPGRPGREQEQTRMPRTQAWRKVRRASGLQAVGQASYHGQQHTGPHIIAERGQSTLHTVAHNLH